MAMYGGYYSDGVLNAPTQFGVWWSSSNFSFNGRYTLNYNNSTLRTTGSLYSNRQGNFIRCVRTTDPPIYMQEATSEKLAELIPNVGDSNVLKDERDDQEYTIAKLADDKYWMVTNLNLAGGTEIESSKSNVAENYTLPVTNGFLQGNRLPDSSTEGFDDGKKAFVYNSGNTASCASPGCYSYYSWTAATAGSGINIASADSDAEYDICPKGWRLPTTRDGVDSSSDVRGLINALGGSAPIKTYNSSTNPTGTTLYRKLIALPYSFLVAGSYFYGAFSSGSGVYWTATSQSSDESKMLLIDSSRVWSAGSNYREIGYSVRCVFSD